MSIGIPYAYVEWTPGGNVRICPVCGESIPEGADATGEPIGNPYGDHYVSAHEGQPLIGGTTLTGQGVTPLRDIKAGR